MKRTIIVGASPNPWRYAHIAAKLLADYNHETVLLGLRPGQLNGREIIPIHRKPYVPEVHTITLYISPEKQKLWYDYLIGLKPVRIVFNPGTENPELEAAARAAGIEVVHACTLVMLHSGQY
jgi:predicted CoA-binding protein